MNCEYKLTLDKEYVFNTEQELNDVLQGVDMEAVVANPSKYKVENGRVVENQIKEDNQLTEQQRQNIQELKQLEPAYAVASDKVVQSFIESIYPESKVKDVVWHGSNVTIDNFEIRKEPLIHFGTINAAKQRSSEFENFVLHPSILNIKDLRKVEDGMWFGQKVLMYLYENKLISEQETAEISNKSYQEGNNYQGENPSQRNQVIQKAFNKNITEFLNTNNLGNLGFVYENFSEDKGSNSYAVFEPEQITILNSPETIQKFKEFIGKEQRITTGTKSIQNYKQVLDKLAKKFNIRYQLVNDSSVNWKGKFQNGVVYINEANFTDDTLFHEFIHPFIEAVKTKNPKLYQQLSNEIQTDERGFNTLEKVKQLYPELNEEEQIEEAIVQLMGEYSAEIVNTAATEKSLFGYLRKLWNLIRAELKSYLRKTVSVEELSPTMTLEELSYLIALGNKPINLWSEQRVRAEKITNNLLNKGFVITGSLALSKQGTVIRPSDEVHDLDFYVQLETDDDLQKNLIEKDDFRQELITMNALRKFTVNDLAEQDWFKNLLLEYPELKSYRIITSKEAYEEGINPETAKVIVLTNLTTVSQGVATRTIRTNIDNIPVDFFVTYQPISNVQGYRNADAILEIKQEWAREKDLQDVANYKEHKPKYQKTNTKQQEVLNTLNKLKVDKKDAKYTSGSKDVNGVTTFIDYILEKLNNPELGYKFNLDEFLFNYKQDLNAKYKVTEITNVKEQNDVYAKIEEEVNAKKNDMKAKTDAGSKLHLVFESVFNGVEPTNESDFTSKEVFDTVVNQAKAVKVKLINESKAKFGTEPVFVTEKPIIAKMLDGNQLAGTIDLMVIHENGTVDILDWKTSTKDAGEWDDNKKKHIYFQTQFYKRMLESLGLTVNEPKIVPATKFDVVNDKVTNVTIMEARTAKQEINNSVQIDNVVSQYFEPKTISRESQPVTNQINNFLEKAFNYKKEVVDTEVTDEDIAKFKKKNNFEGQYEEQLINSSKKISYYDSIKNKRVEYESDSQIKEYLQELKQYNANVRDRMISFYNDLKEGKEPKYKVNNFAKDDKTAELTAVFNRYVDWDLIEDDVVMKELDVIGFKNPRTNQVAFITVNPEQEGQLDLNFSKGNKLEFRENTVLSNYRKSVQDIRMMKATTSNLHLIKLGLFVATANKIDGDIEHIIVLSEKNSPQIQDMNTIQHNIKEILKQDDFGFKVESKEYKVNKLDTLQDFYNSMIKLNTNKKKYDDIMKQLNKEDAKIVLAKRQAEMMREYSQESLKENQEFILLNDALLYLNNIQLEIEEDISAWGYFVYSGNRSSAETDTPNNIVNKIVQQVKKLIDYAITQFRYEYEEWYPTFAKVTKKLIDSKQSLIRQNVVGDTDKVFENIIDKETMTIKPLNQLNKEEREFAEYFMNEIDKVRQRTMGSNYAKLTEEQKREIPLIKAYTEQSKGTWEQRIKSEWEDMLNTDNLLSVDFQENRKQRVEIANRFAYQESHRQDVLLSGEKFETNLAYVLNTYLLHDIKRRKFNEVMPTINALKFMAFTSDVNMFKNLQNVYSVVDSLIDNVVFNTNKLSPEGQKSMKIVRMLSGQVQNLAIGLSPMTGLVQGLIGIMNNVSFAVSNKLVSTESYGKALGKAVTKNIKDIEKRDKLNNLYGLVSKDIDLVAKQNSFINTGLRAFGSRWLHWFNYIPDFFNRTVMFTAKMIEDGNYDAHTVVDDVLVYDETKDKRFFTNGKFDEKHPDLLFLKSKLKEEGGLDSIGKAKRAYTFEEIRSIKEYVNQVHGYMSKEDKIKFSHTVFGVMYMQFKSWLRSKLDQYWKTYRVNEVIGHWQQIYEYEGDSIKLDENGNPVLKRDENGVPIKIWTGTPEEGFINTLLYMMFEAKQWNPNKLEGWRQQNLKQGFTDIALVALMAALSAALDDDDQERDRIEYLMYKLSKDAFIFNAVSSNFFTAQMPVASISYSADMLRNIWNISDKGLEPIIYQIGLTRSAYNLIAD